MSDSIKPEFLKAIDKEKFYIFTSTTPLTKETIIRLYEDLVSAGIRCVIIPYPGIRIIEPVGIDKEKLKALFR